MKKRRAEKRLSIEMKLEGYHAYPYGPRPYCLAFCLQSHGVRFTSHPNTAREAEEPLDSPRRRRVRATDVESASGTGPVMMLIGGSGTDVYIRNNLPTHAYILYSNVSLGS